MNVRFSFPNVQGDALYTITTACIICLLTSVTLFFAFTNLVPCRISLQQSVVCILLILFCLCLTFIGLERIASFCIPLAATGYLCYIYRNRLDPLLTVSCSLSGYICYILSDNIQAQLLLYFFRVPVNGLPMTYGILFCTVSLLVTFLVTFFPGRQIKKNVGHVNFLNAAFLSRPASLLFSALFCLSLLLLLFRLLCRRQTGDVLEILPHTVSIVLCLFAFLAIFLLIICLIEKNSRTQSMLEEYQNLQLYTDELETMNLRFRSFRHDYIDIMSTLSGYIENNDMEGLRRTFEHNITPLAFDISSSIDRLSCLSHMKIPELKALISLKLLDAQHRNIRVFLDMEEDIASVPMEIMDLSRILGIFFNNALDELASPAITDKILEFGMIKKEDSILLVLKNTTLADKSILSSIQSPNYSSKGKGHGIGLYTVSTILGRYSNAVLTTSIENSVFMQLLELHH